MDDLQTLNTSSVIFLGEQDGPFERELKTSLICLFKLNPGVRLAFLVRVSYIETPGINVALCLYLSPGDFPSISSQVAHLFGQIFGPTQHLDIYPLSNAELEPIGRIANAFYMIEPNAC